MKMIPCTSKAMSLKLIQSIFLVTSICVGVFFANPTTSLASNSVQIASIFSFSGEQPKNLGVKNGQLTKCPQTPNCVSSQSKDVTHKVDPLTYNSSRKEALNRLKTILKEINNAEIIEVKPQYLYSQFTSRIMGFVDDVEFYLPLQEKLIHVRSASRVGQSDLGVNRRRIERIREQFKT
jgi:uncharacterized protein (DUF1499 family)